MIKKPLFLLLFLTMSSYADPQILEVIFLAPGKVSSLLKLINDEPQSNLVAFREPECVPMGDGCFHPQLGFIEDETKKKAKEPSPEVQKMRTFNSMDVDLVECDKGNYFDIFCGKATKETAPGGDIEIWVDTSSSLRGIDYSKDGDCHRRAFVTRILNQCEKNVAVFTFDTSKRMMGTSDSLCIYKGLNDQRRLQEWVNKSRARHVVIITDVDELSPSAREWFVHKGAIMHGGDYADLTADKLVKYSSNVIKSCKK